jgi:multidrug efflux pump subunit AcrA (membrane-fusion protein)
LKVAMTERTGRTWLNYLLGLLCVGAVVAAILVVGPASGSTTTVTRTAKAAEGVVQSTVSGSGNLQAASQLNLGFKTSGTVTNIYVTQGQHVTEGQLLATLDPQSAEVTLEQSKAALLSAEANLAKEEETDGEASTGSGGSGASGASDGAAASAASVEQARGATASVSHTNNSTIATAAAVPTATTPGTAAPSAASPGTTTTPDTTTSPATTKAPTTTSTEPTHTTSVSKATSPEHRRGESESSDSSSKVSESSSTAKTVVNTATREANLASARAAVKSDQLTVQSDEEAVANTKLYAPESGTIVSLSGQVGEVVSASGTTRASNGSSSSGSGSSGSGASALGGASTGRSATGASSSSSSSDSSSSSSSSFAVLSDLSSMQLVVALSESEIGNVKVGQIATVTVEALEGRKLAAHVSEVATLSTSSSGVVSYDVTFQLDQMESGLRPGMSATAEVVVKQAEGVNVPTTAISAGSVTVVRNGKDVRQRVSTGLAGNTSTIVLSGLNAGETVVLPAATSTSSSTSLTSRLSRLAGGAGGLGGGGGGGGFVGGGGGGAAFFRGGG